MATSRDGMYFTSEKTRQLDLEKIVNLAHGYGCSVEETIYTIFAIGLDKVRLEGETISVENKELCEEALEGLSTFADFVQCVRETLQKEEREDLYYEYSIISKKNIIRAQCDIQLLYDIKDDFLEVTYVNVEDMVANSLNGIFSNIIHTLTTDSMFNIRNIKLLSAAEEKAVLDDFVKNDRQYVEGENYIDLFEKQVLATPNHIAARDKNAELTYREFNEQINRVANALMANGIEKGDVVGCLLPADVSVAVAILGIMKTGAAYLPISSAMPMERIAYMMQDSKAKGIVTNAEYVKLLDGKDTIYFFEELTQHSNTENPGIAISVEDTYACMYTSGSTGRPKGVLTVHQGLYEGMYENVPGVQRFGNTIMSAPITFIMSTIELIMPIIAGDSVFICEPEEMKNPVAFRNLLCESDINLFICTPSYFDVLTKDAEETRRLFRHINVVLLAGEKVYINDVVKEVMKESNVRIFDIYGSTELHTSAYRAIHEPYGFVPPFAKILIHNREGHILPPGLKGEVYVGSTCVGNGYMNNPEETQKHFLDNYYGRKRTFRTGDIGVLDERGYLRLSGRNDFQVKIRGYRVETKEVETVTGECPGIKKCIVVARTNAENEKYLCAFYEGTCEPQDIKAYLEERLPGYMIPSFLIKMEALPMLISGKYDIKKLTELDLEEFIHGYEEPTTEVEKRLCSIWQAVLGLNRVGVSDNLFEIGGDSIKLAKIMAQIKQQMGVEVNYHSFFSNPTVRGLTQHIHLEEGTVEKWNKAVDKDFYEMTPSQVGIYLNARRDHNTNYNLPYCIRFDASFDVDRFKKALKEMVDRHEILRTTFRYMDGKFVQKIQEETPLDYEYEEVETFEKSMLEEFVRPFRLDTLPLLRTRIIKDKSGYAVLFDIHHILVDGYSMNLFFDELGKLYEGKELDAGIHQYRDYSERLLNRRYIDLMERSNQYWIDVLDNTESFTLNFSPDYPANITSNGCNISRVLKTSLSKDICNSVKKYCKDNHMTEHIFYLGCTAILFRNYCNQKEFALGMPVIGRDSAEAMEIMGVFVHTLPMVLHVEDEAVINQFFKAVKNHFVQALDHQFCQLEQIKERLSEGKKTALDSLFNVMFVYQNNERTVWQNDNVLGVDTPDIRDSKYDLLLEIEENGAEIEFHMEYVTSLFEERTIRRMMEHLLVIIKGILKNDKGTVGELSLCTNADNEELNSYNHTGFAGRENMSVVDWFAECARQHSDCIAVEAEDGFYSYQQLDCLSNKVANALLDAGVSKGDIVPFIVSRNSNMVIAMLGILKAGCAYMPIDSAYPQNRIDFMVADSDARVIVSDTPNRGKCGKEWEVLWIEEVLETGSSDVPKVQVEATDLCYCIYTSGSTGQPKGTLVEHKTLTNLIDWQQRETSIQLSGRVLAGTTISFDVATQEIFSTLLSGGTLIVLPDGVKTNLKAYCQSICDNRVDVIFCTPSFFDMLSVQEEAAMHVCRQLSDVVFAGEALSIRERLAEIMRVHNVRIHNQYGPTESHVVTAKTYATGYWDDNHSIGKPIQNTHIYIMDDSGKVLPAGVAGELCIAGTGVGRGYYKREELTRKKFVYHPNLGTTIYRTGDLARWNNYGELQFLGRMDDQVKVRGQRVELGEIRNVILKQPKISDAAVVVSKENDSEFLCAYVVSKTEIDFVELSRKLRTELAEYMVPELYMRIESIPLSNNGKVLKSALPRIEHVSLNDYVAPSNPMQEYLCSVFEGVLGIKRVGILDNFFKIGGHSLKAMQLINEIETTTGMRIEFKELFNHPTVQELSEILLEQSSPEQKLPKNGEQLITAAEKLDVYPASPAQRRMYVINQMNRNNCAYNIPVFFQVKGKLHIDRLNACLNQIVNRHSVFRTTFGMRDGEVVQIIQEDMSIRVEEYVTAENFVRPFDVEKDALLRVGYDDVNDHLILDMHHIIADGITVRNLVNLIKKTYETGCEDDCQLQYYDYSEWLRKNRMAQLTNQRKYWLEKFGDEIPVLNLLTDYPRPVTPSFKGKTLTISLDPVLCEGIRKLAAREGVTPYMVFLGALYITISKYSRQQDVVIGTPVSGRTTREMEAMLGLFVSTLPLRLNVNQNATIEELLTAVKNECAKTLDNQEYPLEDLINDLGLSRDSSRNPLFDIVFNMHTDEYMRLDIGDVSLTEVDMSQHYNIAKFDLNVNVKESRKGYDVLWEYATDLFNPDSVENMLSVYQLVLKQMVEREAVCIRELEYCDGKHSSLILRKFNSTTWYELPYTSIGKAFEAISVKNADKTALVFADKSYTYKELYNMAVSMCLRLDALGAMQKDRVAVCIERCEKVIALQLATLMKGCVFVPIDNDYPNERIQYIIQNSNAQISVVDDELLESCDGISGVITLTALEAIPVCGDVQSYEVADNVLEQECYNIYTSGSTGKPKGCRLNQKGILNFCLNNNILETTEKLAVPVGVSVNSVAFDFFIAETLFMLLNGYTVVLADRQEQTDQRKFKELVTRNHVNIIQTTPTRLGLYVEDRSDVDYFEQFEMIVLSGEELKKTFFTELKQLCKARIYNPCGPSEASVWAAGGDITDCENDPSKDIHIGKPICNTRLYVVDESLHLLPPGMPGELAIGGVGVGLGYIDGKLTADKFVDNPYGDGMLYRTGDLAAWNKDGNIRYLGRIDQQVKIKGIRIEIGEIESVIKKQDDIKQAVVIVKELEQEKQLWAYFTSDDEVDVKSLRTALMAVLPKYMVPSRMLQVESIFYNANGKLDKSKFPDIPLELSETSGEQLSDKENRLLEVLKSVLGVSYIGTDDDFFELGGDSIKAIRVVTKFRELGYEIAVKHIMSAHSIKAILEGATENVTTSYSQEEYVGVVEESPIIREFLSWRLEHPEYFNQCNFVKLESDKYTANRLRAVLNVICKTHDMLRATLKSGVVSVMPYEADCHYSLMEYDIREVVDKHAFVQDTCTKINASMNLATGPLIKVGVFLDEDYTHILFAIHHLVIDGVSWRIFMDDFHDGYNRVVKGQELPQKEKTASYSEWVQTLKEYGNTYKVQSEFPYWSNIVENLQTMENHYGSETETVTVKTMQFALDKKDTTDLLLNSHRAYSTETNELLIAALVRAMGTVNQQEMVSITMEGHGREELHIPIQTDRTIGWFTNLYPQNFQSTEDDTKLILHVKETIRKIPNKGLGYGIFKGVQGEEDDVRKPSVCFNYLGDFDAEQMQGGLLQQSEYSCGTMIAPDNRLSNDISINCMVAEGQLKVDISYDASVFNGELIAELLYEYETTLLQLIRHCTAAVSTTYSASDFGDADLTEDDLSEILNLFD